MILLAQVTNNLLIGCMYSDSIAAGTRSLGGLCFFPIDGTYIIFDSLTSI
jgi:hypothetical protein